MIQYPTIDKTIRSGIWHIFDKLDGSNIRVEWTRKNGFCKFGKRHGLLDDQTPYLHESKDLILDGFGDPLSKVFRDRRVEKATAFFEFYGSQSAFGIHYPGLHRVSLIDVHIHKRGILNPADFMEWFGHLEIASLLGVSNITDVLIHQIKTNILPGMTFEGVVCKKGGRHGPEMFKIKSDAWLNLLKDHVKQKTSTDIEADKLFDLLS